MNSVPRQMALGIALNDQATLDNFFAPPQSVLQQAVAALRGSLLQGQEPYIYLWGSSGSGISHLLQGACHCGLAQGLTVQYLPLDELADYPPSALLEGMEQTDLVCLDNLQAVAGKDDWEQALFHLYNGLRDRGHRLLVGANISALQLPLILPDLKSRISWGLSLHLPALSDDDKRQLLQFCAQKRGITLSDSAAQYLLSRIPRGVGQLMATLDRLDQASLQAKRKLTVPFIRDILALDHLS